MYSNWCHILNVYFTIWYRRKAKSVKRNDSSPPPPSSHIASLCVHYSVGHCFFKSFFIKIWNMTRNYAPFEENSFHPIYRHKSRYNRFHNLSIIDVYHALTLMKVLIYLFVKHLCIFNMLRSIIKHNLNSNTRWNWQVFYVI